MAAARSRRRSMCSRAPITRRRSSSVSCAEAGARTSRCALRPSTACPVSSWEYPGDRCRPRRSRSRGTSFGRCTWCAIRTSCGTLRRRRCRPGAITAEQSGRHMPAVPDRCDEEVPMNTQTAERFQHVAEEKLDTFSESRWLRIRTITYWTFTVLLVFELAAGSLWNLLQIEWVRVQLHHLGYPLYYTYITGLWQIGGAAAIIAPGFPRLKEWAYAGSFFQFSGAVVSHLLAGDFVPVSTGLTPLVFSMFVIVSWALRPADRRLPNAGFAPETRPLAWAVPLGILLVLFVVSYLTLPAVNAA